MKKSIQFNLKPDADEIETVGEQSINFLKSHGFSDYAVQAQIGILREFIKIGIEFGQFTPPENQITVHIQIAEDTITVETKNPIDETCCDRLKGLDKKIQFIRGYQDPFEAYMLMQKEAFKNFHGVETNGLGLARIAYEAKAILDFFVTEDNILNLSAVRSLDDKSLNSI